MIRVILKDISSQPKRFSDQMSNEEIGLTLEDYVHFIAPVQINATVYKASDNLFSEIHVEGRFESLCARTREKVSSA